MVNGLLRPLVAEGHFLFKERKKANFMARLWPQNERLGGKATKVFCPLHNLAEMKKPLLFLFATTSLSSLAACGVSIGTSSSTSSSTKEESTSTGPDIVKDYLKVEGEKLIDHEGKEILLRGTNLGGVFIQERWMDLTDSPDLLMTMNTLTAKFGREDAFDLLETFSANALTKEDFKNLKDLGFNCLRLPISYMDVFDCDYDLLRSDNPDPDQVYSMDMKVRYEHLEMIDNVINEAEENGMYVIIDLHGAFGSQNGQDHSIDSRQHDWLWREDDLGDIFRQFTLETWEVLATRYQGYKNVAGYDLLNEPAGYRDHPECITYETGPTQFAYFDELYKAIRAIDKNHIIIMESVWTAENLPKPSDYGWENVIYEFHHYENGGVGDDATQIRSYRNRVENILNGKFGVPLYMGEMCPHCSYEGWETILDLFNEKGISWTSWNFKVKRVDSEWGLFNIRIDNEGDPSIPVSEVPHIVRGDDSALEIERKWGEAQRKGLYKNEGLCEVISKMAKQEYPRTNKG